MAISSLLKSKGITPDITSIASRLAVDGKPRIIANSFLCTVFNLSRLSLFHRHISPLGLMCLQGEEMKKERKIDAKNIEEEFQFHGLQARFYFSSYFWLIYIF
jgi:hypothetical protein